MSPSNQNSLRFGGSWESPKVACDKRMAQQKTVVIVLLLLYYHRFTDTLKT